MPDPQSATQLDLFRKGLALHQAGSLDQAAAIYSAILAKSPTHFDALHLLGVIHLQQGRAGEAVQYISRAVELNPGQPVAYNNLAVAFSALRNFEAAVAACDAALDIKPDHAEAHYNRGGALRDLGRFEDALASFGQAIVLRPAYVEALVSHGALLRDQGQTERALIDLDAVVRIAPSNALAHYNRGDVLKDLGRLPEAETCFRNAMALTPNFAEAHVGLFEVLFLSGRDETAWPEYEWRWRTAGLLPLERRFAKPRWRMADGPMGKTILIHAEQGFGDTVQFCRHALDLADKGVRVVLEVQPELKSLLQSLPVPIEVLAHGETLPNFDGHCPLLSLPLELGINSTKATSRAPYLKPEPAKLVQWQSRLGPKAKPRVGLVWAGRPTHQNDRHRSVPLDLLSRLLQADAEFIGLQKDLRDSDAAMLGTMLNLRSVGSELVDFSDTAAAVALMDIVVSVDTVTAHLAGAMGKPVWILLPFAPDWRWRSHGDTTRWYPSARLFRQPVRGDWETVMSQVATELEKTIRAQGRRAFGWRSAPG